VSEPKRYLAKCPWYAIETQEHPIGEFVLYSDYARLKAEVERLTKAALKVYQELDEFGQVSAKSVHELRDAAKGVQS
jgi:hypothetical protein